MNILLLTIHYITPDEYGMLRVWQTTRYLQARGHLVTVIAPGTHYLTAELPPELKRKFYHVEWVDGVQVIRTYAYPNYRGTFMKRMLNYFTQSIAAFVAGLSVSKPDLVLAACPPPTTGLSGWLLAKIRRAKFVYEVRDLYPDTAVALGYVKSKLMIKVSEALEKFLYRRADQIIAVTPGIKRIIVQKGVPEEKVVVVTNGYEEEIFQNADQSRDPRSEFGWGSKFVVLYTGGHGQAYDLWTLVRAAQLLKDQQDILFVLVGDGEKKREYMTFCSEEGLTNCLFLPPQPRKDIPRFCEQAQVGVNLLPKGDFWKCVLGNKVFDYLGAGLPMVYAGEGDTADVLRAGDCGIVVEPQNPRALADAIFYLYQHPDLRREMGARGREHVVTHYARNKLLPLLEEALRKAAGSGDGLQTVANT